MRLTLAWLRLDVRRHWRSLTVLALLIGIAGATVMAALAGARRGASVQDRLNARTLPSTATVLANTPGFDWGPIRALPEVEASSLFVVDYTMSTEGVPSENVGFPYTDDEFLHTLEKPVIFKGRLYDSTRADEAVVTRQFVSHFHKGIGDTVVLILATPKEIAEQQGSGPDDAYTGPRVTVRIVGVGETSTAWGGVDQPGGTGGLQPSPGLYAHYPENIVGGPGTKNQNYVNALVRLRGGEAAIQQLRNDVVRITGRSDIEVTNLAEQQRVAQHHVAFESRCLVAFAVAAFVAALFLVGQAIVRYAAASTEELRTLRALGMTPRQAIATAAAGPVIAGLAGACLGVAGAVFASRWLPFGMAGLIEPSPGVSVDWVVLGPGLAVVTLLVAAGAAGAAWLALGAARRGGGARRSTVAVAVARRGLPVPIVVGTRFALEAGRGRTAIPVRPALVGAAMGVLGIVAAFTFSHGVSDAASNPERFGQTYQLLDFAGINDEDFAPTGKLLTALHNNADVTGVDDARTAVATGPGGDESVSLWAFSPGPKAIPVVITSGRMAESADEVVLGPRTLAALHTHVGARVELTGNGPVTYTVTGTGLIPAGPHNGYADGGWVTQHGYDAIFTGFKFHLVLVTLRPGARTHDAGTILAKQVAKANPELKSVGFGPPDQLGEVAELREVRVLPIILGLFLALLAVGAVGHALATAVRRRSHDLAVLRALGMTQRQCRWVVVTQATVLAVIGLAFGVPLGLAIGRSVWRAVADYTPIQYVPPMSVWALLLVGPAALVLANALAAWPGHRAARLRIAHILRAE